MPISDYRAGSEGILYWAAEASGDYPSGVTAPAPSLPSNVFWAGASDVPTLSRDDGTREIYGIGSNAPQAIIPGGAVISQDITTRLANKPFIQKMLHGSGGYKNLADLCLVSGFSNVSGDGASFAMRYSKASTVSFAMAEGSAQDIQVQAQFWGLAVEEGSVFTPTPTELTLFGAPLTWHNVTQVIVNGVNVRDVISSVSISVSHNLERKGFRPDYGVDSPWSRTTYALLPRQRSYRLELMFHSPDVRYGILGLSGSGTSVGQVSVVVDDTLSSIVGTSARIFNFAMGVGRIASSIGRGGDSAQEMMSSASIICSDCTLT